MSTPRTGRGPGRPRRIPAQQQRDLVLRSAVGVFAAVGLEAATIDRVARGAGVSRQSVYELFGGKAPLFDAAVAEAQERVFDALSRDVLEPAGDDLAAVARRGYTRMFAFVADNPEFYELLHVAERAGRPALTRLCERLAPVYAEASRRRWEAEGIASGRADNALVALYFAMTEAMVAVYRREDTPDRDALVDLLTEFTVGGITRVLRRTPEVIDRLR